MRLKLLCLGIGKLFAENCSVHWNPGPVRAIFGDIKQPRMICSNIGIPHFLLKLHIARQEQRMFSFFPILFTQLLAHTKNGIFAKKVLEFTFSF